MRPVATGIRPNQPQFDCGPMKTRLITANPINTRMTLSTLWTFCFISPPGFSKSTPPIVPACESIEIEEAAQLFGTGRVTQLAQGLGFNLADAFAGHVELCAAFFQRMVGVHVDAETHA